MECMKTGSQKQHGIINTQGEKYEKDQGDVGKMILGLVQALNCLISK